MREAYEPEDDYGDDAPFEPCMCAACNGHGVVNPLTAPRGFLCVTASTCPACDGTGEFE
jgi:DnaJ-class molecular chaperone